MVAAALTTQEFTYRHHRLLGALDPLSLGTQVPCPAVVGVDTPLPGPVKDQMSERVAFKNADGEGKSERVIEGEGKVYQHPGWPNTLLAIDVGIAFL